MSQDRLLQAFLGKAYAAVDDLGGGRLRRHWTIRTLNSLPTTDRLSSIVSSVEEQTYTDILEHLSFRRVEEIAPLRALLQLSRIDDYHLIVELTYSGKKSGGNVGDVDMISQWNLLLYLDDHIVIDELQGLPREHWFMLKAKDMKRNSQ